MCWLGWWGGIRCPNLLLFPVVCHGSHIICFVCNNLNLVHSCLATMKNRMANILVNASDSLAYLEMSPLLTLAAVFDYKLTCTSKKFVKEALLLSSSLETWWNLWSQDSMFCTFCRLFKVNVKTSEMNEEQSNQQHNMKPDVSHTTLM